MKKFRYRPITNIAYTLKYCTLKSQNSRLQPSQPNGY